MLEPAPQSHIEDEYSRSFDQLFATLTERSEYFDECRYQGEADLAELLARSSDEDVRAIARAEPRFRNPYLIHQLIEKSALEVIYSPERSHRWAEMAFDLTGELAIAQVGEDVIRDLALRALAYQANAIRAQGRPHEAEVLFTRVEEGMSRSADPMVRAEVLGLISSLEKDLRRFDQARDLLRRATSLYRSIGDRPLIGRMQFKEASLLNLMGKPDAAIDALRQCLHLLAEGTDTRLLNYARHNLASYLSEAERYEEAREALRQTTSEPDGEAHSPLIHLRHRWLEGRIAAGLGEMETAARIFGEAQDGFLHHEIPYDAALVGLDRIGVLAELGQFGKIQQLVEGIVSIFRTLGVAREALTALLAFESAARREAADREMVFEVLACLHTSRGTIPIRRGPAFPS